MYLAVPGYLPESGANSLKMPISKDEAHELLDSFKKEFKGLASLNYYVFESREDFKNVYGNQADAAMQSWGTNCGAFSRSTLSIALHVGHVQDASEFKTTLAHEGLGHTGINTFASAEKAALLNALVAARDEPSLEGYWDMVDDYYPHLPESEKAEEVYSFLAERVIDLPDNYRPEVFEHVWQNSVLAQNEPLQRWAVLQVAQHVAHGLRDNSRTIQIVPARDDLQFRTAPREPIERSPAALDGDAKKAMHSHLEALRNNASFANRSTEDLTKLAYWRGIVASDNKHQPQALQAEAVARFDNAAKDPQFLAKLPQETEGRISAQPTQQRTTQEISL